MTGLSLSSRCDATAKYIVERIGPSYVVPKAVVICGSGLGGLADTFEDAIHIDYSEIPHFSISTVQGHASKLVYGSIGGSPILAMVGRFQ